MMNTERVPDIDLGDGHFLTFTCWHPDDLPSNRKWLGIPEGPLPNVERWGASVRHYKPGSDSEMCEGAITFDGEWQRKVYELENAARVTKGQPVAPVEARLWTVVCADPLTVAPSLLCKRCGDHGFIRGGKWEKC